jgi:hypothetical protein
MRYPRRRPSGWTWFSLLALLGGCDSSQQEAGHGHDAGAAPAPRDAAGDAKPDAADLPGRDAETAPELDAGAAVGLDATVQRDAEIDGSTAARDAGGSDAAALPFVCNVPAPASCPTPPPRYPAIAAIIKQRCEGCHSPLWTGPWPLDSYGHVADWQDTIQVNLLDCTMPPPEAGVPITVDERVQILTWIRCGLPQ